MADSTSPVVWYQYPSAPQSPPAASAPPKSATSPPVAPPPLNGSPYENRQAFSLDDNDQHEDQDPYSNGAGSARKPKARWLAGFAEGCGLVKYGVWADFAGVVCLVGILEITLLGLATKNRGLVLVESIGLFVFLPLFLCQLAGTGLVGFGRFRMMSVPANTGAGGVLTGAVVLTALRVVVLFVGMVLLVVAAADRGLESLKYAMFSLSAYMIAAFAGLAAEVSVIPGIAIIGGEIPSRRLRQRAGLVSLVFQILALLWIGLLAMTYFLGLSADFLGNAGGGGGRFAGAPAPANPRRDAPANGPESGIVLLMLLLMVILAIQAAYTYLHYSLYAASQRAAVRGGDTH